MSKHRFFTLAAVAATMAVAVPAQAQMTTAERPLRFGAMTGISLPMGDFGDAANTGWHLTGFGEYRLNNFPATLRGELGYHSFGSTRVSGGGFSSESSVSMIPITVSAVYVLPSETQRRFHLMGGLGLYRTSVDFEFSDGSGSVSGDDSNTDFGINIGGGVSFPLGERIDVVGEARFHSIFTEGSSSNMIPISIGLRF